MHMGTLLFPGMKTCDLSVYLHSSVLKNIRAASRKITSAPINMILSCCLWKDLCLEYWEVFTFFKKNAGFNQQCAK